ncbi:hypothetical protein [Desulfovibrio gilichinskyi]|uniref:Uncharacterized protein n=1 Tax=Desulfovibrio gilichinskyi TaxID=1519643 RepID=A0A1X7EX11_9BACT|nr:hypothetical protein [Desulfovibrio gilichinskyi]SMF41879.1 hypothetical protein SAMN06295933_3446 [Desulfovibrio gilichinskyi]
MTVQRSFSAQEQEFRSSFREMMVQAESTEDVKKFFYQTVRDLLVDICETLPDFNIPDIQLDLEKDEGYLLSDSLMEGAGLRELMQESDLDAILGRLSENAWNRYHHLEKNSAKSEQKIYPVPGR